MSDCVSDFGHEVTGSVPLNSQGHLLGHLLSAAFCLNISPSFLVQSEHFLKFEISFIIFVHNNFVHLLRIFRQPFHDFNAPQLSPAVLHNILSATLSLYKWHFNSAMLLQGAECSHRTREAKLRSKTHSTVGGEKTGASRVRVIEPTAWLGDLELKDLRLLCWSPPNPTCLRRTSVPVQYLCFCSPPCSTTTDCGINPSLVFSPAQSRRRFSADRAADSLRVSLPSR